LPEHLVVGQTTRTQVLLVLGEPDGGAVDESWFVYGTIERRGGLRWAWVAAVGAGYGAGAAGGGLLGNWDSSRRLIIRFDANGVVSDTSIEQRNCTTGNSGGDLCLDVAGGDMSRADAAQKALAPGPDHIPTEEEMRQAAQQRLPADEHVDQILSHAVWFGATRSIFARARKQIKGEAPYGEIVVTEKSFRFADQADKAPAHPDGRGATVEIPYAELEAVQVGTWGWNKWVMIRTKDGHEQFFAITEPSSTTVDRKSTQAAGELLRTKITRTAH
jgi:hypothetical protein